MRDRSKILIIIAAVILCAAMLSACGAAPQNEATAAEPAAVQSSTVEPTPEPEPELPAGCAVTVDGMGLSGSVVSDGVTYVSAAEFFAALDLEYSADGGALNFVWRKAEMSVGGDGVQLLTYRGETYVPVNELCGEMGISLLVDDEYDHLYCTPAAGDWILPEGYSVPVLMYHYVTDDVAPLGTQKALAVSPETMEEYLRYLVDNGYDPIWFEDLEHVDEYDKPVILTFDDGHEDNYSELFPLLKKYNVKATFFVVTDYMLYELRDRRLHEQGTGRRAGAVRTRVDTEPYGHAPAARYVHGGVAGRGDAAVKARPDARHRQGAVRAELSIRQMQHRHEAPHGRVLPLRREDERQSVCHRRRSGAGISLLRPARTWS